VIGIPFYLIRRIHNRNKQEKEFKERYERANKIDKKIKKLGLSAEELKEYIKDTAKEN